MIQNMNKFQFVDWRNKMKKYFLPLGVLGIFMTIAVTLWLTQDNIFYLLILAILEYQFFRDISLYKKIQICPQSCTAFSRTLYVGVFGLYLR